MRLIDAELLEKKFFECAQDGLMQSEETRIAFCTALAMTQLEPTIGRKEHTAKMVCHITENNIVRTRCTSCDACILEERLGETNASWKKYNFCPNCGARMEDEEE